MIFNFILSLLTVWRIQLIFPQPEFTYKLSENLNVDKGLNNIKVEEKELDNKVD